MGWRLRETLGLDPQPCLCFPTCKGLSSLVSHLFATVRGKGRDHRLYFPNGETEARIEGRGLASGHSQSEAEPDQDPGLRMPSSEPCSPLQGGGAALRRSTQVGLLPNKCREQGGLGTCLLPPPVILIFPWHGPATCPHLPTLAPHSCQHEPGSHRGAGGGHVWSRVRPELRWGVVCGVGWVMLTPV